MTDAPLQIGPHRINREIGRGGMGVVYLARDTKLDRDVAIKALPEEWADRGDRLGRFKQEARSLAQLNHPNIAGIHGVEEQEGRLYLVLEYVEGDSLADRIRAGALSIDDARTLAIEIAIGIEAAHGAGVVHRDLKPDNIKVTSQDRVKVLDFGIAKIEQPGAGTISADAPTVAAVGSSTLPGAILGTAQYMSPEQARGRPVDKRSDIWSFGVILYEMLTGASPFAGETISDCIAAVLHDEVDFDRLPSETPEVIRRVIRRCIERDLDRRLHDIADARIELEDESVVEPAPAASTQWREPTEDRLFHITDDVCMRLDREGLDPLVLGWDLQYADNRSDSRTVVMWLPSFGADHTSPSYRHLMNACRHRMITPTPIGMEPSVSLRPDVSLENQLVLLRMLAEKLRSELKPDRLVIAGSSCGGITALRCVAGHDAAGLFDGMLAIDPDLEEQDCFVTRIFADLDDDSEGDAVRAMTKVSSSCTTLFEWISMHEYMLQCIGKMQDDIVPLIRQARSLVEPYRGVREASDSPFVPWLRDACAKTPAVRCVFPKNARKHQLVAAMRMMHLDHQSLGPCFNGDTMKFATAPSHLEMLRTENVLEYLDEFVEAL